MYLAVRSKSDPGVLASAAIAYMRSLNREVSFGEPRMLEDIVSGSLARPKLEAALLSLFSVAALVLTLCGTYGMAAYTTTRRSREFAIRAAVGAQAGALLHAALSEVVLCALIGAGIRTVAFLGLQRYLGTAFYNASGAMNGVETAAVALLMLASLVSAAYLPARRSAEADPAGLLRSELRVAPSRSLSVMANPRIARPIRGVQTV